MPLVGGLRRKSCLRLPPSGVARNLPAYAGPGARRTRSVSCTAIEGFRLREAARCAHGIQIGTHTRVLVSFVRHNSLGSRGGSLTARSPSINATKKAHAAQNPVVVRLDRLGARPFRPAAKCWESCRTSPGAAGLSCRPSGSDRKLRSSVAVGLRAAARQRSTIPPGVSAELGVDSSFVRPHQEDATII
jgi:hypothetical protein